MVEPYTYPTQLPDPGVEHYAITPHDSNNEAISFRGVYIGAVGGDVTIVSESGTAVTYKGTIVGTVVPMSGKRVNNTSTDATNLVGMY